ncbi:MAG TPA: tryptophan synthase subunit alpha [Candidatus Sumerlaeota bacterium]|nr:tryptophan synthase subunit alpha [Candidatus Sumerlaeota bacterium]HMZ52313.1 tryptophan synthase subunit alpha [Candidatus Sumerlaeota bacterium]HNM46940.1 tryptophan synthase subunit alpha [Candidatus Sumerlaeota bacterium]
MIAAQGQTTAVVQNDIDALFVRCREERRAALIPYLTSGFPTEEHTREILPILAESGADLIELGVPFSDPIADGPIIQRSSTIALQAGMTFLKTVEILRDFRRMYDTPVILFGALNPYLARGLENSAAMAKDAGAQGILAADLPMEEADEFRAILQRNNLHLITLIAPTTPSSRVREIAAKCSGFLYCISMKGTTGQLSGVTQSAQEYVAKVRAETKLPLALGFGISRPEHVRAAVQAGADAVVVGSSLITRIEEAVEKGKDLRTDIGAYIRGLADATQAR